MKKLLRIGLLALIILIAAYSLYLFTGNKTETLVDAHVHSYACPMHCEGEKVYDRPGSCPVCNMDLVRIELKFQIIGFTLKYNINQNLVIG
mgnify:CR=1 FL=1